MANKEEILNSIKQFLTEYSRAELLEFLDRMGFEYEDLLKNKEDESNGTV